MRRSREHALTTTAQALAYGLFLAIPSGLLVLLGVFSLVADASDVERLVARLQSVMPREAAELVGESLQRSLSAPGSSLVMTVVGLVLALWSTTSAATSLIDGVMLASGRRDERGFVRRRLAALGIVVSLVAAALLVVGLLVLGPHLSAWLGDATGAPGATTWLWWTAQWPLLIAALLFAFSIVLAVGAADAGGRRLLTPGAGVALVVWLAASGGLAVYSASFGSFEKTWGTLATVVVTLLWLWLGSAALLFGAEINAAARSAPSERARD